MNAPFPWIDVAIILVLVAVNGVFSMSELAIVSARTARLKLRAEEGSKGAETALALAAGGAFAQSWPQRQSALSWLHTAASSH